MDIRHAFLKALEERGSSVQLIEGDQEYTLRRLGLAACSLALLTRDTDRSESGAVGILLPNTFGYVAAFFGVMFAGRIPASLNPLTPPAELARLVEKTGIRTIFTATHFKKIIEEMNRESPAGVTPIYLDERARSMTVWDKIRTALTCGPGRLRRLAGDSQPDKTACMLFSSGTTGLPKGVMLTHRNLLGNLEMLYQVFDFGPRDTCIAQLPFFHSFGQIQMLLGLFGGPKLVLLTRFVPGDLLRAIERHRPTVMMLVPEMWNALLRMDKTRELDWRFARICVSGGSGAPHELREAWKKTTGQTICEGYGMTEHSPVASLNVPDHRREGSVGRPLPGVEVEIRGENGAALPEGDEGEICLRSVCVMQGYYENEEATREMIDADGWLRTGDTGFMKEGYLHIAGRMKDIIIVAGENVHPEEIEQELARHEDVQEAAVARMKDGMRGEAPRAFVVPKPDRQIDVGALKTFLRDRLAPYKIPREFKIVEELPRNAMGKVLRRKLID